MYRIMTRQTCLFMALKVVNKNSIFISKDSTRIIHDVSASEVPKNQRNERVNGFLVYMKVFPMNQMGGEF